MPFEEFEQLLKLKKGLTPPPSPSYTLDALSLVGTADNRVADLQITAKIRVRDESLVGIPLQMPTAIMRQPPKHDGPGGHFLTFDTTAGGYVAWLKGGDNQPHVVTLQASVGLTSDGDETRLKLTLPRATEASLRLTIPHGGVEASLVSGDGIVTTQSEEIDRSQIVVLGPAADLQLAWHAVSGKTTDDPPQFDANGDIHVHVESEHRITADASLQLRSYRGPLERFHVRLPPGMELVPIASTGYVIAAESSALAPSELPESEGQLVDVRLDKPAMSASVRLVATLSTATVPSNGLMPGRFDVLGAFRQRGTIDFSVEGEWQLDWTEDSSVRRLDPTAETSSVQPVARFDYFRQPCELQLRVEPRPSRISVEPTYRLDVNPQRIGLEGTLKYRFRGARARGLVFELGDWKFQRVSPDDLFDVAAMTATTEGRVEIPFRLGVTPPAELELRLEAHRGLMPPSERIAFAMPRLVADVVAPATVAISAADNVELSPQGSELTGLSIEPTTLRSPGRQQPVLIYRDLGGGEPAVFSGTLRIRTRATAASARATVRLDRQQIQVEQRLDYRISHEPQRSFVVLAPPALATAGNLQVTLNGEGLNVTSVVPDIAASSQLRSLELAAPTAQIGSCQVTMRYSLPMPTWDTEQPLQLTIPLVVPAAEQNFQFVGQQIEFSLADGLDIEPRLDRVDEPERPVVASATVGAPAFRWSKASSSTDWLLHASPSSQAASIAVAKAWIQTWLSKQVRQERVVFRLTTAKDSVTVRLPTGVSLGGVQAAINGRSTTPRLDRNAPVVRIDLPATARGRECVLELWYSIDSPERGLWPALGRMTPGQIEHAAPPRRVYWQLSLPEYEYLVFAPAQMASEMMWTGSRWRPARQPLMKQRQLEEWMGASEQDMPPRGTNEYLFGTLGHLPNLELITAHRRFLVLTASGTVLTVGLLLIYVRRLRNPAILLALAVVLAGITLAAPEFALILGQWSVLGWLVVLSALVWKWLQSGRTAWLRAPRQSSPVRRGESHSTQRPPSRSKHPLPTTTAMAPAVAAAGSSASAELRS
jgi:hypothetical protein